MNEQITSSLEGNIINNGLLNQPPKISESETVDLNQVIKEIFLKQREKIERLKIISRCDVLPTVKSDGAKLIKIFSNLVTLILDNPPEKNKLFLYIKCDVKPLEVIDLTLEIGQKFYQISFHANTPVCNAPEFEEYIMETKAMVQTLPNSFISLSHTNAGCLFSITLPGKLN